MLYNYYDKMRLFLEMFLSVRPKTVELLHQNNNGDWVPPEDGAVVIKKGAMGGVMCKVVVDGTNTPADIEITMDGTDVSKMFEVIVLL